MGQRLDGLEARGGGNLVESWLGEVGIWRLGAWWGGSG